MWMATSPTQCNGGNALAVGDINKDSNLDIIISCAGDNGFVYLEGNGDGTFGMPQILSSPLSQGLPVEVKLIDWNGDSNLDLVGLASLGAVIGIWLGDGAGAFTPTLEIPVGTSPSSLDVADINKDGLLDFVVSNAGDSNIGLILQTASNVFSPMNTYGADANPDLSPPYRSRWGYLFRCGGL